MKNERLKCSILIAKRVAFCSLVGLLLSICFYTGMDIAYSSQEKYLSSIKDIATIIFGVTGAWLAISYPKALISANSAELQKYNKEKNEQVLKDALNDRVILIGFIEAMRLAIIILGVSLLIPFSADLFKGSQTLIHNKEIVRGILFCTLVCSTVALLSILLSTLRNVQRALEEINNKNAKAITNSRRRDNQNK